MSGSRILGRLAVAVALLVGACGGPAESAAPSATPGLVPTSVPTLEPTTSAASLPPSPSPEPTPTAVPTQAAGGSEAFPELAFVNRFVMRVVVSDLNVRSKPSKSAKSNGKAPKGGLFMMYDWPIKADGYTWYAGFTLLTSKPGVLPDLPTPIETGYDEVLGGWMATGTEDTPFLFPLGARCPTTRNLENVGAMLDSERLSCFGSDTLELEGTFGCGGCGGEAPGTYEPGWLANVLEFDYLNGSGEDGARFALHFPPSGPARPPEETRVRVRGHFDDPAASTCRITVLGDDGTLSVKIANDAAEQWCRSKFVVESITPI